MSVAKNEITGDSIQSKPGDQEKYAKGYDRVFNKSRVSVSSLTTKELLRHAYVSASTDLEKELLNRLEKASDELKEWERYGSCKEA